MKADRALAVLVLATLAGCDTIDPAGIGETRRLSECFHSRERICPEPLEVPPRPLSPFDWNAQTGKPPR